MPAGDEKFRGQAHFLWSSSMLADMSGEELHGQVLQQVERSGEMRDFHVNVETSRRVFLFGCESSSVKSVKRHDMIWAGM